LFHRRLFVFGLDCAFLAPAVFIQIANRKLISAFRALYAKAANSVVHANSCYLKRQIIFAVADFDFQKTLVCGFAVNWSDFHCRLSQLFELLTASSGSA